MITRLTIDIDQSELFDAVGRVGQDTTGCRLIEFMLDPKCSKVQLSLEALYGVSVVKIEEIDPKLPRDLVSCL